MSVLIKNLKDFIGIHKDEKIVVCGCGTSLLNFKEISSNYITIGVNDVPALFTPTYLLVTDPPGRFRTDSRRKIINDAKSKYLFTCTKGWRHKNIVHFELGAKAGLALDSHTKIDHFVNSPYVAVGLAYKLGAKHIGLIGVDFTDGHFYAPKDGPHPVVQSNYLKKVNSAYQALRSALESKGTSLYNLSDASKIEIPTLSFKKFNEL